MQLINMETGKVIVQISDKPFLKIDDPRGPEIAIEVFLALWQLGTSVNDLARIKLSGLLGVTTGKRLQPGEDAQDAEDAMEADPAEDAQDA